MDRGEENLNLKSKFLFPMTVLAWDKILTLHLPNPSFTLRVNAYWLVYFDTVKI